MDVFGGEELSVEGTTLGADIVIGDASGGGDDGEDGSNGLSGFADHGVDGRGGGAESSHGE